MTAAPATFRLEGYEIDRASGELRFRYAFEGGPSFEEVIAFDQAIPQLAVGDEAALERAVALLAGVLGISYYKLYAPETLDLGDLPLGPAEVAFLERVYEDGLGEFAYRNGLDLAGLPRFVNAGEPGGMSARGSNVLDPRKSAVLIGGGKDSLVSLEAMLAAGEDFSLFAVNPRKPMEDAARVSGIELIRVTRRLDPLLFDYNERPGTYNGHVPITAIVSLIAAVGAFIHGYGNIVLSNERSADEGNIEADGRVVNHQYSKSSAFEALIADTLQDFISPDLAYFSLLRPLSEVHIAKAFATTDRYDHVFTSCNKAFRLTDRPDSLWCGDCAKCRFAFLLLALWLPKERLLGIFPANLLDQLEQADGFRDLCGLGKHKPWDCVGEELESATALAVLARRPDWKEAAVLRKLAPELGRPETSLDEVLGQYLTPLPESRMPRRFRMILDAYAR